MNENFTRKGFIFSYDAVVSLMFVVFFLSFLTYYVNSFSYSSMKDYETIRSMDSVLNTMIADGSMSSALHQEIQGNTAEAQQLLKQKISTLLGKKFKAKITIYAYDSSGNVVYKIESAYPSYARASKNRKAYSVNSFFSAEGYYGIASLQTWS